MKYFIRFTELLQKIATWVNHIIEVIITASLISILAILIVAVFSRFIFRFSAPWSQEYVSYATAVIGGVGFSALVHRRTMLSITFLKDRLPATLNRLFEMAIWVGVILYFRLFITYGLIFAQAVQGQFSPSMVFPLDKVRLIMPIGGILIVFQAFNNLLQDLRDWVAPKKTV